MAKLKDQLSRLKKSGEVTAGDASAQVDKWTRARAEAVQSLDPSTTRRGLLLAGDEGALDQLDEEETKHLRIIETADILLPGLSLQLASFRSSGRHSAIARHRKEIRLAYDKLEAALSAAIDANEKTSKAYEAATAELGTDGAKSAVGECPSFNAPGFNRGMFEHWSTFHHNLFDKLPKPNSSYGVRLTRPYPPFDAGEVIDLPADAAWPLVKSSGAEWADPSHPAPRPPGEPLPPARFINEPIPHGDPSTGIRLYTTPAPPDWKPPPKVAPAPAPAPVPKRTPKAALPDNPPEGSVRCRVRIDGYPNSDGVACIAGELVDVKREIAVQAIRKGGSSRRMEGDTAP